MKVLVIDNFDSFTYNLVEYLSEQQVERNGGDTARTSESTDAETETVDAEPGTVVVEVLKNTASLAEVEAVDPDAIVISPGPGHPENDRDVGVTTDVLRETSRTVPTFGVCLGLEAAVYEYGGTIGHAPSPIHGKASSIDHDGEGVFTGLENGFSAARYHSLIAETVPDCFEVSATTTQDEETLVMGIRHREHPIECVQFHPESVLTGVGHDVVANFLAAYVD